MAILVRVEASIRLVTFKSLVFGTCSIRGGFTKGEITQKRSNRRCFDIFSL